MSYDLMVLDKQRMKHYLTAESDLAPYQEMILWKNAQRLFQIKQ